MEFRHIYFDSYVIGETYETNLDGTIVILGVLKAKALVGRPYDADIELTFELNGVTYKHEVQFGPHYRIRS